MDSPINKRLWVDPEYVKKAPLTLLDIKFAQDLCTSYNHQNTMSRKRAPSESADDPQVYEAPEPREPRMSLFQSVTSIATKLLTFFGFQPHAEPARDTDIYTYTEHLGSKRRRVVTLDPSLATPPTPLVTRFKVPGAWPVTSEAPSELTPENAQAAWDVATEEERKRMVQSNPSEPYWRQNGLPPHFPYASLDQMLEHKYLRSNDPEKWHSTNYHNYRPTIRYNHTVSKAAQDPELPSILHPIYLRTPPKAERFEAYPWQCQSKTYERVLDANSYRPFTGIRKFAYPKSPVQPKTVEDITNKIKYFKSIADRRDYDRKHPGVLHYRQQTRIGLSCPRPKDYPSIQKSSPNKYNHGQNRPVTSVLKTSHPKHHTFEPYLAGDKPKDNEIPTPTLPAAKTAPEGDKIVDTEMMDVDMDTPRDMGAPRARAVHWPATSQITGKLHQPTKIFYKEEPITSIPPEKWSKYRNPTPPEDDSLIVDDTPKRYFGHEQDNEPTYAGSEPDLEAIARDWESRISKRDTDFAEMLVRWGSPFADPDSTPSKATQQNWIRSHEKRKTKKQLELDKLRARIDARHEEERQVRAAIAARRAEEERRIQKAIEERAKQAREAREQEAKSYHHAISLIKPLSQEWSAKVDAAMAIRDRNHVVIPAHNINRHDLGTILPQRGMDSSSAWLNDQIVNNSLKQIVDHAHALEQHDRTKPAKYWAANSNWFTTVSRAIKPNGTSAGITRWLGKRAVNLQGKNFLEAEIVLLPVCSGNHWTLVVVKPKQRIMEFLDSLSNQQQDQSKINVALMFIKHELGNLFVQKEWSLRFNRSPQQTNGVDCGAFVIMNAMATIRGYEPLDWIKPGEMLTARRMIVAQLMNGGYSGEFQWMEKVLEMPSSYQEMLVEQSGSKL